MTLVAKAQGTWPLRTAESSVLHGTTGTCKLVKMTWLNFVGFHSLLRCVDVAVTIVLACLDLRPTSLFALLVYTYPLLLGNSESQYVCK